MWLFGRPPDVDKLKAKRDVPGLIKALAYKKDEAVRRAAAKALGEIRDARAIGPLIAAFEDQSVHVSANAILALGQIGDPAIEPLSAALKDKNARVRDAAAGALGFAHSVRAVDPLLGALRDEDKDVRKAAVEALGKIGDARAVEPLTAARKDRDKDVRKAAVEALGKIGDARAVKPVAGTLANRTSSGRKRSRTGQATVPIGPSATDSDSERGTDARVHAVPVVGVAAVDTVAGADDQPMTDILARTAAPSRTFRVFVSSTFEDFKAERNALQGYVFPRLQELCAKYQKRFQAIDLRWGVSEEAGLDQRAVAICLDEIARCQRLTPRPNFILLLGDRYGWRPLPSQIDKAEFEAIRALVPESGKPEPDRAILGRWYWLDENADPAEYVLLPRVVDVPEGATTEARKAAQTAEYETWRDETEPRLRAILLAAVDKLGWAEDDPRRAKYVASATEQEIVRGVLEPKDAAAHVFGFYRTILTKEGKPLAEAGAVPPDGSAKGFLDETEVKVDGEIERRWVWEKAAHDRLVALKGRLPLPKANVSVYSATWIGPDKLDPNVLPNPDYSPITLDHIGSLPHPRDPRVPADPNGPADPLDSADPLADCEKLLEQADLPHTLCNDVWRNLARMILDQVREQPVEEAVEAEVKAHEAFGKDRCRIFIGRDEPLAATAKYLKDGGQQPLAVIGEPGSGKSALMAKAFELATAAHSKAFGVVRFIGATPGSSDGRTLLGNLCGQITRAYSADESTVPTEYNDLAVEFGKRLELATAQRPLIVFLDALDQLGPTDPARALSWLPAVLPDHVRLVVSAVPGDCERALKAKRPEPGRVELDRMTRDEGETALGQWLARAKRTLREQQRKEILDRFEPKGRPLYLKLAFEEARLWPAYDEPGRRKLSEGIPALISENLFARLAEPASHGRVLVSHALGFLAASRYGLSEDELIDVLSADLAAKGEFRRRSPRSPKVARLPVVVWSRLYFDLEPYLSEHAGEGTTLLAFYHNQLREAAAEQFLTGKRRRARHAALASYFRGKADPDGDRKWEGGSVRGLGELPYHLAGAGEKQELYETLTDFTFLEHKAKEVAVAEHPGPDGTTTHTYAGVYQLQNDYEIAIEAFGGGKAGGRKPLIVTGTDFGKGLMLRCPWCNVVSPFDMEWRGKDIPCPNSDCQGPLRVNKFVVGK